MTCPARAIVLVVDDEALVRLDAEECLREAGFETLGAANAAQALAELEAHQEIAIIVSDINMPGDLDGLDLARCAHETHPDVPTILTSGKLTPPPEALYGGAFLPKPYTPKAIVRAVEALLAERCAGLT